jgi:hypothetical protein
MKVKIGLEVDMARTRIGQGVAASANRKAEQVPSCKFTIQYLEPI